jgi:hypothetical protein
MCTVRIGNRPLSILSVAAAVTLLPATTAAVLSVDAEVPGPDPLEFVVLGADPTHRR